MKTNTASLKWIKQSQTVAPSACCAGKHDNHDKKHKQDHAHRGHEHDHNHNHDQGHRHDHGQLEPVNQSAIPANAQILKITLDAMDCPTEAAMIREAFHHNAQVHRLEFDLINRVLTVTHSFKGPETIHETLIKMGLMGQAGKIHSPRREWIRLILSGTFAIGSELLNWFGAEGNFVAALALLAIILAGTTTLKKGWQALRQFTLNINLLMSVAVLGAVLIGEFPEAAVVIFLFSIAEKIEAATLGRARNAIAALQAHAPDTGLTLQADGTWLDTPTQSIRPEQIVRARPGERIALDGIVTRGTSSVNQAPITGESMPVEKQEGDQVYAGTLNQDGVLEYQVTTAAGASTLDRIANAIQQAQQDRAPMERMIDRFAKIYTPSVFLFAILLCIAQPLFFDKTWLASIYESLVLLVIACPCALVISTPVTVVSALTRAARMGVIIKGGRYLEQARHLKTIAFDKTGTLTAGRPVCQKVLTLTDISETQCLNIAASLNSLSQHPIAKAIVNTVDQTSIQTVSQFRSITGRGVAGEIDSVEYILGNERLISESGIKLNDVTSSTIKSLESNGMTVVILGVNQQRGLALFAVADQLRAHSINTVSQLNAMNIRSVMLTGDNLSTANSIAAQVGINTVHAELLPEDKLKLITDLQQHGTIAMVGDGVNDAPALARADIGVTLGAAGSATALETADIALMQDDLTQLPALITLSKRCANILMQNITIALGIKLCFVILTLMGQSNLWMAVFADMGASLLVIFNGLRLLKTEVVPMKNKA